MYCTLVMQWRWLLLRTVSITLLGETISAKSEEEDHEDDDNGLWGIIIALAVVFIVACVLVICRVVAVCEFHRNKEEFSSKTSQESFCEISEPDMQGDPPHLERSNNLAAICVASHQEEHAHQCTIVVDDCTQDPDLEEEEEKEVKQAFDKQLDSKIEQCCFSDCALYDLDTYELGTAVLLAETNARVSRGTWLSTSTPVFIKCYDDAKLCYHEFAFSRSFTGASPELNYKSKVLLPEILDVGKITISKEIYPTIILEAGQFTLKEIIDPYRTGVPQYEDFSIKSTIHQICLCLQLLHETGFVHGNLTLETIMFFSYRWKLFDFSYICNLGENMKCQHENHYSAPEVYCALISGNEFIVADPAIDIWSLGCIIYEFITRKPLLPQSSFSQEDLRLTSSGEMQFPWEEDSIDFWSEIEFSDTVELIQSCLHRDPNERWSIQEIIQQVRLWS
eukprot:g4294.t1